MPTFNRVYAAFYLVLIAVLAVSTFCTPEVYGTAWFAALWGVFAAGLCVIMVRSRLWRRPGLFLLHVSFLVILAGGLITRIFASEGTVILSPGRAESYYIDADNRPRELGFTLELCEFEILTYPGGEIPRDYISRVSVNGEPRTISVNSPLEIGGKRLLQSSYINGNTSVIGVRADSAGTAVSFGGYALFFVGGLMSMVRRRPKRSAAALVLLGAALGAGARTPVINAEAADSLARGQVYYGGRVVTVSTVCNDVLQKVYGRKSFRGLPAERVVLSFKAFPAEWAAQPLIKHGKGHISLRDCFDSEGRYLLAADAATDERVGLLLMLTSGSLARPAPPEMSPLRVEAEIIYNRLPLTPVIFILFFLAAALALFRLRAAVFVGAAALLVQGAVIAAECVFTGHGPFASTYQTLQLLVVVTAVIALALRPARFLALLAAGCMALVAHLQAANPIVTPLMPVLHSPWLALHVTLVMTSYSLLAVGSLAALAGIIRPRREAPMRELALRLIRPGVWLLGLGIFSGAVWANVSWGRYWGWDPKETWALITFMAYALPLHRPKAPLWWMVAPLAAMAMTYFGVNLLPSLHAYS